MSNMQPFSKPNYKIYFVLNILVLWTRSDIDALPWSFVYKTTNSKHQITNKSQITNSKPVQRVAQVLALRERLFFLGF